MAKVQWWPGPTTPRSNNTQIQIQQQPDPTTARSNNSQVQQWPDPTTARSNNSQVQQQPGPTTARSNDNKSPMTAVESRVHWHQSQWTKGGAVNTKVYCWETPSLPRRWRKDGGEVEEGTKGNEERRKGGGKCDNEGRKQQAEFEINYNSGKGTFFFQHVTKWHFPLLPHCLCLLCPCCPPLFVAFGALLNLATGPSFIFWVDLVSPSSKLWCSLPLLLFTDFGISGLRTLLPLLDFTVWTWLLLDLAVVGFCHHWTCHHWTFAVVGLLLSLDLCHYWTWSLLDLAAGCLLLNM